jgi:hypothetical protein
MKISLFGTTDVKLGKHNLKDPRLDQAHKLVEADKKTNAQVDVVGEDGLVDADGILASHEQKADLLLKDLEFVETRLGERRWKRSRPCSKANGFFLMRV